MMSKPETTEQKRIEQKRAALTPEGRAALEARLRHAAAASAESGEAAQPRESVASMVAQWGEQPPPDWLDWEALAEAAERQARATPERLDLRAVPLMIESVNRLSVAYTCAALRELGAFTRPGERHTAEELVERFGVLPQYTKLMRRWLDVFEKEGLLAREGESFVGVAPLPADAVAVALGGLHAEADYGDYAGIVKLMQANCRHLAAMIAGRQIALENFFAGGSSDLPDVVYQGSPHARYFNHIARELLETAGKALPAGRQLRVLEVGAGVGGTTKSLLPVLPPDDSVYVFTDVSAFFLKNAERSFGRYPFTRFQLYNIDEDPLELGFAPHTLDVVLGANVLHCARDLGLTLRRLRTLLQPGGLLVLIEVTRSERWHNIAMGLLTGFFNFEDERLEANEPLLSVEGWERTLRANGFGRVAALPAAGLPTEVIGQHVILARAD